MFAVVWGLLYFLRKDTRREMILTSFFCAPLGPIAEFFHVMDYWRPETITGTLVGPEDIVIAFLIGGISAVLYEYMYEVRPERVERPGILVLVPVCYAIGTGLLALGMTLGIGSEVSTFILLSVFALVPLSLRPRLIRNALFSGIAFMTFMFLFYQIFFSLYPGIVDAWWFGATGVRVLGVPVEEIAWGFLWGMVAGICSEFVARIKLPRYIRLS